MKVGYKIKKLRELKGLSQENFAEELGMSTTGYGKIERDEVDVNLDRLERIGEILGMRPEDILTFDEKNVFNNSTLQSCAFNNSTIHHSFPEKLQQLYEDKIKLLEEKIKFLEEQIRT